MRTALDRRPYRDKAAVHADGAMRGRAAVPSAAARRQDGGSPYGGASPVVTLVATILTVARGPVPLSV